MVLAKKMKILRELHGGVCIAAVCHKSTTNVIQKVKKIYVKLFLSFCQHIACACGTFIHFLKKQTKDGEDTECGWVNKSTNKAMMLMVYVHKKNRSLYEHLESPKNQISVIKQF
jgi:DNA-binding Xre family transcriptional regulator